MNMNIDIYMEGAHDEKGTGLVLTLADHEWHEKIMSHPLRKTDVAEEFYATFTPVTKDAKLYQMTPEQMYQMIPYFIEEVAHTRSMGTNTDGNPAIRRFFYLDYALSIIKSSMEQAVKEKKKLFMHIDDFVFINDDMVKGQSVTSDL